MKRYFLFVVAALLAVGSLEAVTVTSSKASLTVTYNEAENKVYWTWTRSPQSGSGSPDYEGQVYLYSTGGTLVDTNHTFPLSGGGNVVHVSGYEYFMGARNIDGGSVEPGSTHELLWSPGPSFKITFHIPAVPSAANGGVVVHYEARNAAGDVLAEYSALPGDPASEIVLAGLETDDPIYLVRLEGSPASVVNPTTGEITIVFNSTGHTPIANGIPLPGSGAQVGSPTTPVPNPPTPPAPPVTPVTPSTPTTPPDAPGGTTPVDPATPGSPSNPTPTGSDGAKKEDVMANANQISDRIREASAKAVETGNKIIEATDKVAAAVSASGTKQIEATDKVAGAVKENTNKILEAHTQSTAIWSDVRDGVKGVGTKLDAANGKLEDIKANTAALVSAINGSPGDVTSAEFDQTTTATTSASAAGVTGIISKLPAQPGLETTIPKVGFVEYSIPMPLTGDSVSIMIDLRPWETQVTAIRAFIAAVLGIWFYLTVVKTIKEGFA